MVRKMLLAGSVAASLFIGVMSVSGVSAATPTTRPSIAGTWNISMTMLGIQLGPSGRAVITLKGKEVSGKLYQNGRAIDSIRGTFNATSGRAMLAFTQLGPINTRTTVQAKENPAGDVLAGTWKQGLLLSGQLSGIRGK